MQLAVFPGVQGSIHTQVLAAKAVCLGEALHDDFRVYAARVKSNARTLAATLSNRNVRVVSGGTDTHIVLLDVSSKGLTGKQAEAVLDEANITSNKNAIPNDNPRPPEWVGLRLGTGAATTRGMGDREFQQLGDIIADLMEAEAAGDRGAAIKQSLTKVRDLCSQYPIYAN